MKSAKKSHQNRQNSNFFTASARRKEGARLQVYPRIFIVLIVISLLSLTLTMTILLFFSIDFQLLTS